MTIAPQKTFQEMEKAAVSLGRLVGYVSAGTVEYLYSHADNKFYFLELNPRLQVEHPTTEMVSGVNIPAAQLMVAMGIPLHRIRDIRLLYGADPHTSNEIDFNFDQGRTALAQAATAAAKGPLHGLPYHVRRPWRGLQAVVWYHARAEL